MRRRLLNDAPKALSSMNQVAWFVSDACRTTRLFGQTIIRLDGLAA